MGGDQVRAGEEILNSAGIPTFAYPDTAARAFDYMWRYSDNLRASTKHLPSALTPTSMSRSARKSRRSSERRAKQGALLLTEIESKEILSALRHSCRRDTRASSEEEAVEIAREHWRHPSFSRFTPKRSRTRPTWAA